MVFSAPVTTNCDVDLAEEVNLYELQSDYLIPDEGQVIIFRHCIA